VAELIVFPHTFVTFYVVFPLKGPSQFVYVFFLCKISTGNYKLTV